jgi:hypothetical protein
MGLTSGAAVGWKPMHRQGAGSHVDREVWLSRNHLGLIWIKEA